MEVSVGDKADVSHVGNEKSTMDLNASQSLDNVIDDVNKHSRNDGSKKISILCKLLGFVLVIIALIFYLFISYVSMIVNRSSL
jgi:hypothetical protein